MADGTPNVPGDDHRRERSHDRASTAKGRGDGEANATKWAKRAAMASGVGAGVVRGLEAAKRVPVVGNAVRWVEAHPWRIVAVAVALIILPSMLMLAALSMIFDDDPTAVPPSQYALDRLSEGLYGDDSGRLLELYQQAGSRHQVPWTVLAGLGETLTTHGSVSPYDDCNRYPVIGMMVGDAFSADHLLATIANETAAERCTSLVDGPLTVDDLSAWQDEGPHRGAWPPIGDPTLDQALGPFLLTREAADELGYDRAQSFEESLDVVAERLAEEALRLQAEGRTYDPFDPEDVGAAQQFWLDAVDRISDTITDPSGEMTPCGEAPAGLDTVDEIGYAVREIWQCTTSRARRTGSLHVVTAVHVDAGGAVFDTLTGKAAADRLVGEALTVSWAYSAWDNAGCDDSATVAGIFPLPKGTVDPDSGEPADRCDIETNIRVAARLVVDGEARSPEARLISDANPYRAAAGGWLNVPYALGDATTRQALLSRGPWVDIVVDPDASPTCEAVTQKAMESFIVDDASDAFVGHSAPLVLNPHATHTETTLERLLRDASLTGTSSPAYDAEGPCSPFVRDADEWRRWLADRSLDLYLALKAAAAAGDEPVDDDLGTVDPGHIYADRKLDSSLYIYADRDHYAEVAKGLSTYLDTTTGPPAEPEPGSDAIVSRLDPHLHTPLPVKTLPGQVSGGATLSVGASVLYAANRFGGVLAVEMEGGSMVGLPGVPACGNYVNPGFGQDPQVYAQLIYQIFYCNAVLHGADQEPPSVIPGAFNGADYGFTNKAQQVASEAVVVAWCESVGLDPQAQYPGGSASGLFQLLDDHADLIDGGWDNRFDPVANVEAAAHLFFGGYGREAAFDGWSRWAVVWMYTDSANSNVYRPILPRFASNRNPAKDGTDWRGVYGPDLPAWAVNPFLEGTAEAPTFPRSMADAPCKDVYQSKTAQWPLLAGLASATPPGELPAGSLPAGAVEPIATAGGATYYAVSPRTTYSGFHEAYSSSSIPFTPIDSNVPHGLQASRGRGTSRTSAIDVMTPVDAAAYAPVTGTVVRVGNFTLYDRLSDQLVVIDPDEGGAYCLKVLHVDGVTVRAGDRVQAGRTVIATRFRDLAGAGISPPHAHYEVFPSNSRDRCPAG